MIDVLNLWVKNVSVVIVIVSIIEMLLPNNQTKKYIRMILGIFVIFNIVSPLIQNKEKLNFNEIELDKYETTQTSTVDQTSMDERIKELSEKEIEKDIGKKLEERGYIVTKCKVGISDGKEKKIINIRLIFEKLNQEENTDIHDESKQNKVVTEIQNIRKVDTKIHESYKEEKTTKATMEDIKKIKEFLMEEYEVKEKCLEIN